MAAAAMRSTPPTASGPGVWIALALSVALFVAACATGPTSAPGAVGKPYRVNGVWYTPRAEPGYDKVGVASWYGGAFHNRRTASGEKFDMEALTAAHPTLPFGTRVKVTNLANGRSVVLTVNDRGPFVQGRLIDVSRRAAKALGFHGAGTARVRVQIAEAAGPAPAASKPAVTPAVKPAVKPADDATHVRAALNAALEGGEPGSKTAWRNPETGRHGVITPLTAPAEGVDRPCRNYRRTVAGAGGETVYVGRACRAADGSWRIIREKISDAARAA